MNFLLKTLIIGLMAGTCACTGQATTPQKAVAKKPDSVRERVVMDHGNRAVRTVADSSISHPELMRVRKHCFVVISKKDYYLYVYEPQCTDTVLLARYDCALALRKGDKKRRGDMRTPHCVAVSKSFHISQIVRSGDWKHDFGDGRGSILSYGPYFMRLSLDGHPLRGNRSIGIHGSTNNRESVPGRASEGCIRLKDEDIRQLRETYAYVGMPVIIKAESQDDLPFEARAMQRQHMSRKRHFTSAQVLSNEQIAKAKL